MDKEKGRIMTWALCMVLALGGCTGEMAAQSVTVETDKPQVVATLFPQYDFARQIAGDAAQVRLLLPPGTDSHAYEPTPQDVLTITQAKVFLYTGDEMEPWAAALLAGMDKDESAIWDVSAGISLSAPPSAIDPQTYLSSSATAVLDDYTDAEDDHVHAENDHVHGADGHRHDVDPHIWTSPSLARKMAENVLTALSETNPENHGVYEANWRRLDEELALLEEDFRRLAEQYHGAALVFGSPFAAGYFVEEYGFRWASPYAYCGHGSEPSPQEVTLVVELLAEQKTPAVFYQEPQPDRICQTVAEESGSQLVLFHTCHNVTAQELEDGETYVSLMRGNLERLRSAFAQG